MRQLAAPLIMLALCTPVHAEPFPGRVVKDADVALVFDYLREAVSAAMHGREAAPPAALIERAEAIAEEAKRRGEIAGRAALDVIEREIRDAMRRSERRPGAI